MAHRVSFGLNPKKFLDKERYDPDDDGVIAIANTEADMTKAVYDPDKDGVIAIGQTEADMTKAVYDPDNNGLVEPEIHDYTKHANRTREICLCVGQGYSTAKLSYYYVYPFLDFADSVVNYWYVFAKMPTDLVSLDDILVVFTNTVGGNQMVFEGYIYYSKDGLGMDANYASSGALIIPINASANVIHIKSLKGSIDLSQITKEHVVAFRVTRSGGHGSDTNTGSARIHGLILRYTADM